MGVAKIFIISTTYVLQFVIVAEIFNSSVRFLQKGKIANFLILWIIIFPKEFAKYFQVFYADFFLFAILHMKYVTSIKWL